MITLVNHQGLKVLKGIQLQSPSPPIGLAYLGAYLKLNNYDYHAVDACGQNLEKVVFFEGSNEVSIQGLEFNEAVDCIPEKSSIVGFTCNFSHCWPIVNKLAALTREKLPNALLIIGGEHCTAVLEYTLRNSNFDLAVCGEGEETLLDIVKKVELNEDWRIVKGVGYINAENLVIKNEDRKRIIDVDSLPIPDWDSWYIENYIQNNQVSGINLGRSIPFLATRGCPYNCKFCSNEGMWHKKFIMRNPRKIVEEMEILKNKYNLDGFCFMDLTFIIDKLKIKDFATELINKNLNISYQLPAGTRCEAFDDELPELLYKSGLRNCAFAPESGDEQILETINKHFSFENFFQAVRNSLKTPMTISCFFVIGLPEDTVRSMKKSLKMIRKLALIGVHDVTVSQFTPYPGSYYFRELQSIGLISTDANDLSNIISFYSNKGTSYCKTMNSKQIYNWMIWMYLNFYIISFFRRPFRVLNNFVDYFLKGSENTRYMRLFHELIMNRTIWRKKIRRNRKR